MVLMSLETSMGISLAYPLKRHNVRMSNDPFRIKEREI